MLLRRVLCRLGAQRTLLAFRTLVCMIADWWGCKDAAVGIGFLRTAERQARALSDGDLQAEWTQCLGLGIGKRLKQHNCDEIRARKPIRHRLLPMTCQQTYVDFLLRATHLKLSSSSRTRSKGPSGWCDKSHVDA